MLLVLLSILVWLGLISFWGGFWKADQRLGGLEPPAEWPSVTAIIPARDEAAQIVEILEAHAASAYPGPFRVVLVDDGSTDGTGDMARRVKGPIQVVEAPPIASGWTGKLWALHHGIAAAKEGEAEYLLLTDADILHAPDTLSHLVAKAEQGRALVSLMARLDARVVWGALLIPAFVFFFQKLYPFSWVNDPARRTAAAAGGCVLIRREVLEEIGGVQSLRGALIDDCTLAASVKRAGHPVWLGLARDEVISLRDNRALGSVWTMVARTAFTQLRHSPLLLLGSTLGMALLYLTAPLALVAGLTMLDGTLAFYGMLGWTLIAGAYRPTARLYGQPLWQSLTLPAAAVLYMAMTLDSARRHWLNRGGAWKGRVYPAG
ncbi:MAG: glycosyltransferase [Pseudomonadota bacterium]